MNYYRYLKKNFPVYIVSGVILSAAVFLLIAAHRYNNQLHNVISEINNMSVKKVKVKQQIKEIDALIKYFREEYVMDIDDINPDALIFRALDDMKTDLVNASITVSGFEKTPGRRILPVEIEAAMLNNNMIHDYIGYVESFRIPDYRISHISISRAQSGAIILNIKGDFVMPSLESGMLRTGKHYG